ncbi:MAG: effector binding domain-containing protein [Pseudomonadales bacterium]|nr:effector binding domain-containing protein [Pseudomonadales bacterium]
MQKPVISKELFHERVIYNRFRGSYVEFRKNARKLLTELMEFAKQNELLDPATTKVMTLYHDNPHITGSDNLRTSIAMTIPKDSTVRESGNITVMEIKGQFAVGHFEMSPAEYGEAWDYMYHEWLFKSAEKPRDSFPFELYVTEPPKTMKGKSLTDIYIPVE